VAKRAQPHARSDQHWPITNEAAGIRTSNDKPDFGFGSKVDVTSLESDEGSLSEMSHRTGRQQKNAVT